MGSTKKKHGTLAKKSKRSSKISKSDKKRSKIEVEWINKLGPSLSDVANLPRKQDTGKKPVHGILEPEKLRRDGQRDKHIVKELETQQKQAEDAMLQQLERISGFNL